MVFKQNNPFDEGRFLKRGSDCSSVDLTDKKSRDSNIRRSDSIDVVTKVISNLGDDMISSTGNSLKEDSRKMMQELSLLVFLYVEKFAEMVTVFVLTVLAISWTPLLNIVEVLFWPLTAFIVFLMISLPILYRVQWFRRSPGFLAFKLLYLMFLTSEFFMLAIHVPVELTFLSPYFALVASATSALIYMFFAFVAITHQQICKVPGKGYRLWLLIFGLPVGILVINQPVYFSEGIWHFQGYWDFTVNVVAGMVTSLPFTYEALYIYQKYVDAKSMEEFTNSTILLPGFVTVYYAKKVAYDNQIDQKSLGDTCF